MSVTRYPDAQQRPGVSATGAQPPQPGCVAQGPNRGYRFYGVNR